MIELIVFWYVFFFFFQRGRVSPSWSFLAVLAMGR